MVAVLDVQILGWPECKGDIGIAPSNLHPKQKNCTSPHCHSQSDSIRLWHVHIYSIGAGYRHGILASRHRLTLRLPWRHTKPGRQACPMPWSWPKNEECLVLTQMIQGISPLTGYWSDTDTPPYLAPLYLNKKEHDQPQGLYGNLNIIINPCELFQVYPKTRPWPCHYKTFSPDVANGHRPFISFWPGPQRSERQKYRRKNPSAGYKEHHSYRSYTNKSNW